MPTVLSFPFACSALTPRNRVKKKRKKGEKEGRNDTQRGKETGDTRLHIRFRSIKSYSFRKKDRTFLSLWHTRAIENCTYIYRDNGNRTLFSLSLTFFRPFVLNVAKISNFARLYYPRKLPEGVRSARTFADPCRILVHQDAAAIVSNAKKGWLRFRWKLEDGKADKTRDWWFTIAPAPRPNAQDRKCGAHARVSWSRNLFLLLRRVYFAPKISLLPRIHPRRSCSSLASVIPAVEDHPTPSLVFFPYFSSNFCSDTIGDLLRSESSIPFLHFFFLGSIDFFFLSVSNQDVTNEELSSRDEYRRGEKRQENRVTTDCASSCKPTGQMQCARCVISMLVPKKAFIVLIRRGRVINFRYRLPFSFYVYVVV